MGWKDESAKRIKDQKSGATFKLLEGPNCFRILPNANGPEHPPLEEFRMHYGVGPDERAQRCGKDIQAEGECIGCDKIIPELLKSESSKKRKQAEAMQPKECFVVQVSKVDDDGNFQLAKPWWVSTGSGIPGRHPRSLSITIHSLLASSKANYEHPVKGKNLNIDRTGTGQFDTKYDPPIADENPTKVPSKVLASIKPFEEIVPQYDEDKFLAAYEGREEDEDEEKLTSRPRTGGNKPKPSTKTRREEPEDEEENEGAEEPEGDEPEEGNEPEEDEEVDEPEPPRRSSKPAPKPSRKPEPPKKTSGKTSGKRRLDDDVPF